MSANDGGPAFPYTHEQEDGSFVVYPGMSLRDWFAGMAAQGWLARHGCHHEETEMSQVAFRIADAMIAERDK